MKKIFNGFFAKAVSLALSASMMLGIVSPLTAFADEAKGQSAAELDKNGDGTVNYVVIGSYDAAGFGLSGYDGEKFGYGTAPSGSYAGLVKSKIEASGKDVKLTQLGIGGIVKKTL